MVNYILASKPSPYGDVLFERLCSYSMTLNDPKPQWNIVKSPEELENLLKCLDPDYIGQIFFFHWGWIVKKDLFDVYPCVVIHTSNLPEGRGGSPLQNQIVDGIWQTKVNALKMVSQLDAGGIYASEDISLQGSIHDIWWTIMLASEKIIVKMMSDLYLTPSPQQDTDSQPYKRRKRLDSLLPTSKPDIDLVKLYDHIRMLDGNNYPRAYVDLDKFCLEFSRAKIDLEKGEIICDTRITTYEPKQ